MERRKKIKKESRIMKESVRSKNLYQNSEGNWYYKKTINENRYKVSLNTKEINEAVSKRDGLNDLFSLII